MASEKMTREERIEKKIQVLEAQREIVRVEMQYCNSHARMVKLMNREARLSKAIRNGYALLY